MALWLWATSRWRRQRPPAGSVVPGSSGLSLALRRRVDELSQPVRLPGRASGRSGSAVGARRRLAGGSRTGVAGCPGAGRAAGARVCRSRLVPPAQAAGGAADGSAGAGGAAARRTREPIPAAGDRRGGRRRAAAAREREARIAAAQERMQELEAERARREKTNKQDVSKQKEPRASTTDAEARVMKMADGGFRPAYNMQIVLSRAPADRRGRHRYQRLGSRPCTPGDRRLARPRLQPSDYLIDGGFTKNDDIEWAHGSWNHAVVPAGADQAWHRSLCTEADDSAAVADWRQRMASDSGKTFYRERAEHECINARARRMGLRQLTVRGKEKARTVLLWFALAHNMLRTIVSASRRGRGERLSRHQRWLDHVGCANPSRSDRFRPTQPSKSDRHTPRRPATGLSQPKN